MQLSFPTSAMLAAFPFKPRHITWDVYDKEAQKAYVCVASATGLSALVEMTGAGGGGMTFGSPVALTVGGSNTDGVGTDAARNDHKHALPAFGSSSGTFAEGNDARLSDDRTASGLRTASTVVGVSSATAPSSGQVLTATSSTAATWQDPAGTSGGPIWDARVVPAGLHATSDDFLTDTIGSAKWTKWDPNTFFSGAIDTTVGRMVLTSDTSLAALQWGGYYQNVPSTLFTVLAYVSVHGTVNTTAPEVGVMVGDFAVDDFCECGFVAQRSASDGAVIERTTTSATAAGTATAFGHVGPSGVWVCLRVDATSGTTLFRHDYSSDGVSWSNFRSDRSLAGVMPHVGILFGKSSSSTVLQAAVRYFRVFDGTATFGAINNGGLLG